MVTQVCLGELLLGAFAFPDRLFERGHLLCGNGFFGFLRSLDAGLRIIFRVHLGRQRDLFVGGEQGNLADFLEVHAHRVVDGKAVHQFVGVDQLFFFDLSDGLQRRFIQIIRFNGFADAHVDAQRLQRIVDAVHLLAFQLHFVKNFHQLA